MTGPSATSIDDAKRRPVDEFRAVSCGCARHSRLQSRFELIVTFVTHASILSCLDNSGVKTYDKRILGFGK